MTVRVIKRRITPTGAIRAEVFARSLGECECGCGQPIYWETFEMDHAFGRIRVEQSARNCWALTSAHHHLKTANNPSASCWVRKFLIHAIEHDYWE